MALAISDQRPLLTFGIVSDVQYADFNNGMDYSKTRTRYYRNSLTLLKNAINDWKCSQNELNFVLQLGDLIDGCNKRRGEVESKRAIDLVLNTLKILKIPVYHLLGNHEFYNFNRSYYLSSPLNSALSINIHSGADNLYYTFLPHPKVRFVALDSYEVSLLGYADDLENENYLKAKEIFSEHNPNENINSPAGLIGFERRWTAYNGGLSQKQLQWLSETLRKAQSQEENVVIVSHIAFDAAFKDYTTCLSWNYEDVINVIHNFDCVVAVIAGHEHDGYHNIDSHGVQHITFPAIIETVPGDNAYATASLWSDKITIAGVGKVPNYEVALRFKI